MEIVWLDFQNRQAKGLWSPSLTFGEYGWWKKSGELPGMYKTLWIIGINYLSTGVGFLPLRVWLSTFKQKLAFRWWCVEKICRVYPSWWIYIYAAFQCLGWYKCWTTLHSCAEENHRNQVIGHSEICQRRSCTGCWEGVFHHTRVNLARVGTCVIFCGVGLLIYTRVH